MFSKITFVGAGQMAEAIIAGLVKEERFIQKENIYVTNYQDDQRLNDLQNKYGVTTTRDKRLLFIEADVVILSMKPTDLKAALKENNDFLEDETIIVSMLAGTSSETIESLLNKQLSVIRTMPNTSAMVEASATAISKGKHAEESDLLKVEKLFKTVGKTFIIDEEQMHAFTSIAGSGPAYFYNMIEALEAAAIKVGLNEQMASEIVYQTFYGASQMLSEGKGSPTTLRENITSPNGTTEAGLNALKDKKFFQVIEACVKSAYDRSIQMDNTKENE